MGTFKIKVTEKVMSCEIYEIEADSEDEAIDLYCNELAGSIEPIDFWYKVIGDSDKEEIICVG